MAKYPIEKHTNDEDRCPTAKGSSGQCPNRVLHVDGERVSDYCSMHGGNRAFLAKKAENLRNYRLSKWQHKLNQKTDSPALKSLSEEIGILRVILEEKLNALNTTTDLIIAAGPVSDLILKIEKLVLSAQKLDEKLGRVLDRAQVIELADRLVSVLEEEIESEEVILAITKRFSEILID